MREPPRHLLRAGLGLVLLVSRLDAAPSEMTAGPTVKETRRAADARRAVGSPSPAPATASVEPRAFLIYLKDGGEPIVVTRYVEEHGEIRFEKYGGWIGIPSYEILRIVPDEPDRSAALPFLPRASDPDEPSRAAAADLYLTLRGGGDLKVTGVEPEGDRMRVSVPDGSFTVPRSEIVGVVRVPPGFEIPEAWLAIVTTGLASDTPARPEPIAAQEAPAETPKAEPPPGDPEPAAPAAPGPRVPYQSSDRAHFVRLSNGQLMRLEGFWVEDGQLRFRRLGGIIGVALAEVLRLIPEELAPVPGRTQARFVQRLGPDLIEVRIKSGGQRVRLLGVAPVNGTRTDETPWRHLERGTIIHLEFDRQRYDVDGNWLAYVFLPNNRMLNAELVRLGLARPVADGRNIRYIDLLHELATGDLPDGAGTLSR